MRHNRKKKDKSTKKTKIIYATLIIAFFISGCASEEHVLIPKEYKSHPNCTKTFQLSITASECSKTNETTCYRYSNITDRMVIIIR